MSSATVFGIERTSQYQTETGSKLNKILKDLNSLPLPSKGEHCQQAILSLMIHQEFTLHGADVDSIRHIASLLGE